MAEMRGVSTHLRRHNLECECVPGEVIVQLMRGHCCPYCPQESPSRDVLEAWWERNSDANLAARGR